MNRLKITSFTAYEQSIEEVIQGSIYSQNQKEFLSNLLVECAEIRLSLEYDPLNPVMFAQQEAYQKGKIDLLRYLLDSSEAAVAIISSSTNPQ